MKKIKAILFDMDGVLIDASEWHYEALNQALRLFGHEITRHDHLVTYNGLPTRKKLELLTLERSLPIGLHDFINEMKQEFTFQIGYTKCYPSFNQLYALTHLKKMEYRMVVCSNSIKKTMDLFLQKSRINNFFEFYLSNQDVINPKPSPEIYKTAIKILNLSPDECLILEDNEHGIKSAKESGASVMIIKHPNDVTYDAIIKKITEVEEGIE